ncbi:MULTISPECIES: HtaA domain-containing protein [Microbacterium]|uniref:HtaA domain-containing protein n=1 Tax=Microbacterium TaxID=33882 RepID=UPI001D176FA9|nr:HtaA domain-containing protein [Microbacterium testaceum]MCC4248382.1 HtaA domain-containing protein [Microbacterium testaceum]
MSVLVWAVKRSLVGYVRGMADGAVVTTGGAHEVDEGFAFPGDGRTFFGRVTFTGHGGMMRVALADPALVAHGDTWMLEIADPDDDARRLPFAAVAAFDGTTGTGVSLTADGADLFFGPYEAGTPLEDLLVQE